MVQYPEFDEPAKFGTSMEGAVPPSNRVARTLEDPIAEGDRVSLQLQRNAAVCNRDQGSGPPRDV
jgi:hypothetical protein